ncbi:MAG: hypothetical protein AAB575_00760 [Patescibacteria group bacterium]
MGEETKPRASVIVFENGVALFDEGGLNGNRTIVAIWCVLSGHVDSEVSVGFLCAEIFTEITHQQTMHKDSSRLSMDNKSEDYYDDAELIVRINCQEQSIEVVRVSGKNKVTEVNCSFTRFVELFNV